MNRYEIRLSVIDRRGAAIDERLPAERYFDDLDTPSSDSIFDLIARYAHAYEYIGVLPAAVSSSVLTVTDRKSDDQIEFRERYWNEGCNAFVRMEHRRAGAAVIWKSVLQLTTSEGMHFLHWSSEPSDPLGLVEHSLTRGDDSVETLFFLREV